jgi:two-component SAPR family response regulator
MYDDWAAGPRERVMRRYLALLDLVATAAEDEGALDEAARLLDLGIAADSLDEQRYVRLGQLLHRQGRRGAARQIAERGIAVLAELGVDPSDELTALRR